MAPMERANPPEESVLDLDASGLKILIVADPRCLTLPLLPNNFDSWGTVYGYFICKSLLKLGANVEMESVGEIMRQSYTSLDDSHDFDAAIIIVNRASSIYGEDLFSRIRDVIKTNALIYTMDDHDREIEFEDLRFAATIVEPEKKQTRKMQVYWGCDPSYLVPRKSSKTLRVLLDTWHFEEKKWDRTRDILISAVEYFAEFESESVGKEEVEILAWTEMVWRGYKLWRM